MKTSKIISGFDFLEERGDATFYCDAKGNLFYKLGSEDLKKVKNENITYRHISTVKGVKIKFENNGVHGFSLFRRGILMEDNIWTMVDAERIAKEISK